MLTIHATNPSEIKLESLDDGPGLLPYKLGPIRLTTHHHTFLQYVQLDYIEDKIELLMTQLGRLQNLLSNETYLLYELQINYLTEKLVRVSDQLKSLEPSRVKRGLVDGLGSIIKSITGNLDYKDALNYNNAIKLLENNQDKMVTQFNNHVSLSKEWMSKHSSILTQLVENQIKINNTLELILNSNIYREDSLMKYAKFAQLLVIIGENIEDLMAELIRVENMLAFIRVSTTHHSMIDISVLKLMIDKLRNIYNKDQIIDLELREYYDIIEPGCYYTDKQIVIIFKFPIISADTYDLYKLSIVPNKVQNIIIPPYPFIAINENSFMYMETECPKVKHWYLCEKEVNQRIRTDPDCVQQLILHQVLNDFCQYTTVTLAKEAMEKLDDQHYVLSFPHLSKVHLVCDREEFTSLQGSYLISIPVKCYMKTAEFTIVNESDEIKGQPLKLMQIPFSAVKQDNVPTHLNVKSIDLQELHSIQEKIMQENPLQLDKLHLNTFYHTTIPLYVFVLGAGALIIGIATHRYKLRKNRKHKEDTTLTSNDNVSEQMGEAGTSGERRKMPATFYLNVLK